MSSTGAALYGAGASSASLTWYLRCHRCDRLLAEAVSPPYRIRCRCGSINQAAMTHVEVPRENRRRV